MPEDNQYEDAESYQFNYSKDKLTFKDIILQHLKRISEFASVEFRGGYWHQKPVKLGNGTTAMSDEYVPDSREVYCNAVEALADMLYVYFDDEMRMLEEDIKEKIEKIHNACTKADNESGVRVYASKLLADEYRGRRRRGCRRLFRGLCEFLYRKKYLELGSIED